VTCSIMAQGRVQAIAAGPARKPRFAGAGTPLRSAKDGITRVSGYRDLVDEEAVTRQVGGAPGADPQTQRPEPEAAAQDAGAPRGTWDDPRLPWSGRPRRVDVLLWAGIVLSGLYYWALLPFVAPLVGTHPVLLEVLNGNTAAIISAAAFVRVGHGSLVIVLLAAIPGLMKFDWLYW